MSLKDLITGKKDEPTEEKPDKEERVLNLLENLMQVEDVLACLVAKRGLEGGLAPKELKITDLSLWRLVNNTTDDMFDIVKTFYKYDLDRIYLEIGKYTIIMATLNEAFALIVIIPSLANRGLIDIGVENTKRQILQLLQEK